MQKTTKLKMLTLKEAASLIDGITEYSLRRLCLDASSGFKFIMLGKKYMVEESNLFEFFRQ